MRLLRFRGRGVRPDDSKARDLPPGSRTKGDPDAIPGTVREAMPYDEEPEHPDALRPDPERLRARRDAHRRD